MVQRVTQVRVAVQMGDRGSGMALVGEGRRAVGGALGLLASTLGGWWAVPQVRSPREQVW